MTRHFAVLLLFAAALGAQPATETLEPARVYHLKTDGKTRVYTVQPGTGILRVNATLYGAGLGLGIGHSPRDVAVSSYGSHLDCGPIQLLHDGSDAPAHYVSILPSNLPDGEYQLRVDWLPANPRQRELLQAQSLVLQGERPDSNPRDAAALFGRALEIYRRTGDNARIGYALFGRGSWLARARDYPQAADDFREAAARYADAGYQFMQARSLQDLGDVLVAIGRAKEAGPVLQQSLAIFQRDRRLNGLVGDGYLKLANVQQVLADANSAASLRLAAAEAYQAAGRMDRFAGTIRRVAAAMTDSGDYGAAIRNADAGLTAAHDAGDRLDEVWLHVILGECRMRLLQRLPAERQFKEAIALAEGHDYYEPVAHAWVNLASVYVAQKKNAESEAAHASALAAARAAGPNVERDIIYQSAINNYHEGRREEAVVAFGQAVAKFDEAKDWARKADAQMWLGAAYAVTSHETEAIEQLSAAVPGLRASGNREHEAWALELLMRHLRRSNPGLAIAFGKQAVALRQATRRNLAAVNLARRTQVSYLSKVAFLYRSLADLLITRGRLAEAEQVMRLLKGAEYDDFTSRGDAPAESVALSPDELKWQAQYEEATKGLMELTALRDALLAKPPSPDIDAQLKVLDAKIAPGNRAFSDFLTRMQTTYKETSNTAAVDNIKSALGLQGDIAELPEGTVAIYTLMGSSALRLVLVTPSAAVAYVSPIGEIALNRKIAAFREALRNPSADPRPLAKDMYGLLVPKDLEAALATAKATTLMWSLDGALRYVPFAALYDGEHWLIERYRLSLFNLSSRGHLKDEPASKWQIAGFGVTKAHGDFAALPAVGQELDGIKAATQADVRLDGDFTEDALVSVLRRNPKAVHIASHFALRPGDVQSSFLLLGDGNRLSIADLNGRESLFRGVELLTLSACDTASGTEDQGDGHEFEGLARVAEDLGAKAVMATLWPVADASTGTLMQDFYKRRAAGNVSKSEALRQAQLDLIHNADAAPAAAPSTGFRLRGQQPPPAGFSHPYHWAPFVLIGNWK